ncbi:MAG TPA: hypothetical protein DEB06_08580 [Phycisphaerales bacterium]|nr:hypothetical protein [Phycisphaerales bacterium]
MFSRCRPCADLALAAILLGAAWGCAASGDRSGEPDPRAPRAFWSPGAGARLVTLDRSTTYTIVRREGVGLIIIEQGLDGGESSGPDRAVWLVSVPVDAPFGRPIDLESSGAGASLLEYRSGRDTHAQTASGTVTILSRNADSLTAQVDLTAPGRPFAPGQVSSSAIEFAGRLEMPRYQPHIPTPLDPAERSGVDSLVAPPARR